MKKNEKSTVLLIMSLVCGAAGFRCWYKKVFRKTKERADRYFMLFRMMDRWVRIHQEGRTLLSFFVQEGYQKIAIYGIGYAGETLLDELKDTGIQVAYGIDKNSELVCGDLEILSIDDYLENVDAVIVTAVADFGEIKKQLKRKMNCPILSLDNIIYEVL